MAPRPDYYKTLGVDKKATPGRDQEGLPQARAQVPPRPQPGRQGGRGALQGDLPGPRRARRPREAQAVRQRHRPVRRRRPVGGGGFGGFGNFDFDGSSIGDILSNLFGGAARRAAARARKPRARARRATSRPRSRSPSTRRSRARRCRCRCRCTAPARPATAPARKPGTTPTVCPRCEGRGIETAGPGHVLDLPAVLALRRLAAPSSRTPARPATARARCATVKRYRVNIPAGVQRRQSRIRLAGKGEAGPARRPARRPLRRSPTSRDSPVFKRKGDNFEVEVPLTIPEALRGAEVEVPTLTATKTLRVRAGHQARHGPAPARRGPAEARHGLAAAGDIHYRFVIDVPERR